MSDTLLHRLLHWAESSPNAVAQYFKANGKWHSITAREVLDRVFWIGLYLEHKGFRPEEVGCIISYNSPEWVQTELALTLMRGISAGLYPNATPREMGYILKFTDTRFLFLQNKETYEKLLADEGARKVLEDAVCILVFQGDAQFHPKAVSFESALIQGQRLALADGKQNFPSLLKSLDEKKPAFMIFTSGTTGTPKGAMLSHENLCFASDVVVQHWNLPPQGKGTMFSFLPLSHIAEKLQNVGVSVSRQYAVSYCSKFESVSVELPEVQPTLLVCVPRVWEKMMEGVMKKIEQAPPLRKHLALWALSVTEKVKEARLVGSPLGFSDLIQVALAEKLVIGKIKEALGLKRAAWLASGAAPLPAYVSRWFWGLGLEVLEDYGQTETSAIIAMTVPGVSCLGTVGQAPEGIEVKLAPDGEILARGKHVFVGYYKDPENTAKTFDGEWLKTGDLGAFDERGFLRIRGRKKEVIKTSGGKMVAPLPIEEKIRSCPLVAHVCMVGEGRKYLAAIVTLHEDLQKALIQKPDAVSGDRFVHKETLDGIQSAIDEVNKGLASFEKIKRFVVLSREFSIQSGELTPTLKMKRHVIESKCKGVIDSIYAEEADD
jgi:long-chain acyl-CoA synthetase